MKTIKHVTLFVFILSISGGALSQDKNGKIILIRSTGFQGGLFKFEAFVDGQLTCKLADKEYSTHQLNVGKHTFTAQFSGKQMNKKALPIEVNVEEGKTYYLEMIYQVEPMRNILFFQEVTENSVKPIFTTCIETKKCL